MGYATVCYALRCPSPARYFAKLWPRWRADDPTGSQRETALSLLRALDDRGLYPRIPCPILTQNGATWASCDGIPFAVFPFLPDREASRLQLGALAGRVQTRGAEGCPQVRVAEDAGDLAVSNAEHRRETMDSLVGWPGGVLLHDDSISVGNDPKRLEPDACPAEPLPEQLDAPARPARPADLDVVAGEVDEPVDGAGVQRLVPRQDGLLRLVSQLRHMCGAYT